MHPEVRKRILSHRQLGAYEEACIVILVLLFVHVALSWSGLLGQAFKPSTDLAVIYFYMFIDWGIPIALGIIGLTFGIIGFRGLKKKKSASDKVKETIFLLTIVLSALIVGGNAGYMMLLLTI